MYKLRDLFILTLLGASLVLSPGIASKKPPKLLDQTNPNFLEISDRELLRHLSDPNDRIPKMFKVPRSLRRFVGFWFKIYVKYSLYHQIIYDRNHPEKIYEVIDNRDLFKKGYSAIRIEIQTKNRVKRKIREYRRAINLLSKNRKHKFKRGSAGAKLVRAWGRSKKVNWKKVLKSLRTQAGQRDRVIQALSASKPFIGPMESILQKYDLPPEISRIPLVESSFNLKAHSKANAVGVWQFLKRSAQEYLIVDPVHKIDERVSPIKATYAAAKMFKRNMRILGDMGLAIIAYHHGPRNLVKLRHKYSGKNLPKLLLKTKKTPLGFASRNYYFEFLALLHAEKYRDKFYGLPEKTPNQTTVTIVKLKSKVSVFEVAAKYNVSLYELRLFNPDVFDIKKKLPVGTRIVIPRKTGEELVQAPVFRNTWTYGKRRPSKTRKPAATLEFIEYIR